LRYEDISVGTGPEGEAGKIWHIKYTIWRAADGVTFDSWDEHRQPVIGKDGKPELGSDGKPKMGEPEPAQVLQGVGRIPLPGLDSGLTGMRIGGKRRLFIPWQMAFGTRALPDRPDHPGIPAKSDLIFDVELVAVTDMPPPHPMMPPHPVPGAQPNAAPSAPAAKPATPSAVQPAAPAQPAKPAAAATPPTSRAPASQPATTPAPPATSAPTPPVPPAQQQTQPK
jgi:peptidylprolyl isomerase